MRYLDNIPADITLQVIMMNHKLPSLLVLWSVALVLPISADAPDLNGKTLSDWTFSEALIGDKPTEENLKGKVVVLEYWGVR